MATVTTFIPLNGPTCKAILRRMACVRAPKCSDFRTVELPVDYNALTQHRSPALRAGRLFGRLTRCPDLERYGIQSAAQQTAIRSALPPIAAAQDPRAGRALDYGFFWMENLGGGKWAKHMMTPGRRAMH